ncbi:MAG: tRNA lysidine(34) synthetase TilS [Pseudomonadota bacterium]|nr:tRNA lysidine(34) synthetase TilS [Pseudomonadota bacterium]
MLSAAYLLDRLKPVPRPRRYWVAFSGGVDSSVLLDLVAAARPALDGAEVHAVYVDHKLQPVSRSWDAHCRTVCRELQVPYRCLELNLVLARGHSLEAQAREARYQALADVMGEGDVLLTGQHRDDQMETFLLQALRGAGPTGLAAMPAVARFGAGSLVRPLLDVDRSQLTEYARQRGLHWVEDASNADVSFDRNYLRHEITPRLRERWPAAAKTLARVARHNADAAALLREYAREELASLMDSGGRLAVDRMAGRSVARQFQLLRVWLELTGLTCPSERKLRQIVETAIERGGAGSPRIDWPGGEVRRYGNFLYAARPICVKPWSSPVQWQNPATGFSLPAGLGTLRLVSSPAGGLNLDILGARITIGFRQGGERCRPQVRGSTRPLKKLLQERRVVPWMRSYMPLLFVDDELAAIGELCDCAPFSAGNGPGLRLEWSNHPPLH